MPISSQTPIIGYVSNGVTKSFAFPFVILSADDLKVKVGADVVTAGFSITGVGDRDGGSVTFADAPASLTPIILYREVTLDRAIDYQENGDLLAVVLDDDFDRIWMAMQDQSVLASRVLRSPIGETLPQLPPASDRALSALAFDEEGNPIVVRGTNGNVTLFVRDIASTDEGKGAHLMGFKQSATGAVGRTVDDKLREVVSVKDFGAVGDGVTDDRKAIQNAIDAVSSAGGGTVYFPPGVYYKPATTAAITPKNKVVLKGAGRAATILKHDDTSGTSRYIGSVSIGNAIEQFAIEDLSFEGMWSTSLNSLGTQITELWYIDHLQLRNVGVKNSRAMGLTGRHIKSLLIEGCDIEKTNGDGLAFWDAGDVRVHGNRLADCNDDAISLHTNDATASPLRNRVSVVGNVISTSQGIKVLGAKNATIGYNLMSRVYSYGVYVDADDFFGQGNTPNHSVQIVGNVINDVFKRVQGGNAEQYYMRIGGGQRNAGPLAAPPGGNDTATASIVSLFGTNAGCFQANNTDDTAAASPGGYFWHVRGNILARTLPAVAAIADWGFGSLWCADEGAGTYSGAVTEADLNTNGIRVEPSMRRVLIEANIIATTGDRAIHFDVGAAPASKLFDDFTVRNNKIADFKSYGVFWPGGALSEQGINVIDNEFDADPRCVSVNRGANGTWAANTLPSSVYAAFLSGANIERNRFKNTCNTWVLGGTALSNVFDNVLHCNPTAVGFSTSNKGIGNVLRAGAQARYVYEDSDPTSATFGQVLGRTLHDSNTMPTAGKYVPGHVVRNVNPTIGGTAGSRYVLTGWIRTTLGAGHVLNTDWFELRSLTGT